MTDWEPSFDGEEDASDWPGLESVLCDHCGTGGSRLLRCGACRSAFFCSKECQRSAWPRHKEVCGKRSEEGRLSVPGSPASSAPGSPRNPGAAKEAYRDCVNLFGSTRFREALAKADAALAAAAAEGSWELHCETLRLRGQCFEQLSELAKAKGCFAEALVEAKTKLHGAAATKAEANALLRLGAVATRSLKLGIAIQYQRKAVALLEADGGDKDTLAAAYNNLGISASKQGATEVAKASFEQAVALRKETGHMEGLCACTVNLAVLLQSEEQVEQAAEQLEEARRLAREAGSARVERQVLLNLHNVYENEFPAVDGPPGDAQSVAEEAACADAGEVPAEGRPGRPPAGRFVGEWEVVDDSSDEEAAVAAAPGTQESNAAQAAREAPEAQGAPSARGAPRDPSRLALRCRRALHGLPEEPPKPPPPPPPTCGACGVDLANSEKRLRCGRCRRILYCGPECQRGAWAEHAGGCRAPAGPSAEELELRDRTCPICLEGLGLMAVTAPSARVVVLPCFHSLHSACWSECLASGPGTCPVCRDNLVFAH